jgi:hypothetical protein
MKWHFLIKIFFCLFCNFCFSKPTRGIRTQTQNREKQRNSFTSEGLQNLGLSSFVSCFRPHKQFFSYVAAVTNAGEDCKFRPMLST